MGREQGRGWGGYGKEWVGGVASGLGGGVRDEVGRSWVGR